MAVEKGTHQVETGPPMEKCRAKKSTLIWNIIGARPHMVVTVVRKIGRRRCAQLRMIASIPENPSSVSRW